MKATKKKGERKLVTHNGELGGLPKGISAAFAAVPPEMSALFFTGDQVIAAMNLGEGSETDPVPQSAMAAYAAASLFKPENKDLRDEIERRMEQDRMLATAALKLNYDA